MCRLDPKARTSRLAKFAAAALLLGAISACSGPPPAPAIAAVDAAAQATQVALPPQDVAAMTDACRQAQPSLNVATGSGMPAQLSGTAVYPKAFCAQLLAGTAPPTAAASSPAWLAKALAVTADVAQVAQVVLPVALKLLPLVAAVL